MGLKTSGADRAARSGFAAKLREWYRQNHKRKAGVISSAELARRLTELGEPVGQPSVSRWENAESLPGGRYIGHLERLMGAPWSYLDDPNTPWPRPLTREALADLIALLPLEQVRAIVDQLESAARGQEPPQ